MTKIQEQRIISPRTAQDPINPSGSTLQMKVQPTEGRPGIYTSTKGRNGGTKNE